MTQQKQIYKCEVCGNIVEVLHSGEGELVCCGQPMIIQMEKDKDEGAEKHVPIVEETKEGVKVKVGTQAHPMEQNHYIEWIEVIVDGKGCKKFLKPGDQPEAEFKIESGDIEIRTYCNVHGLWKNKD